MPRMMPGSMALKRLWKSFRWNGIEETQPVEADEDFVHLAAADVRLGREIPRRRARQPGHGPQRVVADVGQRLEVRCREPDRDRRLQGQPITTGRDDDFFEVSGAGRRRVVGERCFATFPRRLDQQDGSIRSVANRKAVRSHEFRQRGPRLGRLRCIADLHPRPHEIAAVEHGHPANFRGLRSRR